MSDSDKKRKERAQYDDENKEMSKLTYEIDSRKDRVQQILIARKLREIPEAWRKYMNMTVAQMQIAQDELNKESAFIRTLIFGDPDLNPQ